jgi:hypothetical protein
MADTADAPAGEAAVLGPRPALEAPDGAFTQHRWIPRQTVDWARQADAIMMDYGAVYGRAILDKRYKARWRAQRLIDLMVRLNLHHRWELAEHTEARPGGWAWCVEYKGGGK